jgi:hypothetical protein
VFAKKIWQMSFPACFHVPLNIVKYFRDTNPAIWLEDFRLACRAGGADDDLFIIQYLPLYVTESARVWLEHSPADKIHLWANFKRIFVGNFLGTYVRPRNSKDLKPASKKWEGLCTSTFFHFSKQCNELPNIVDADVIGAFISGMTNEALVHKLGCSKPLMI